MNYWKLSLTFVLVWVAFLFIVSCGGGGKPDANPRVVGPLILSAATDEIKIERIAAEGFPYIYVITDKVSGQRYLWRDGTASFAVLPKVECEKTTK